MPLHSRIMIVEDEAVSAQYIKTILLGFGYDVVGMVSTGESALRKAVIEKPDLILMDILLEGEIDGIDASNSIKQNMDIPIIFLTGNVELELFRRAKSIKPYCYIVKPFQERELYSNIEVALYTHQIELELKLKNKLLEKEIEQRKKSEQELLEAKNKAEKANQIKNEFLANVSHEIRTPLNSIIGFAEILKGQLEDTEQQESLIIIQKGSHALLDLINNILDLSKIEAGQLKPDYHPINVIGVFKEMKQIFSLRAKAKDLDFKLDIDDNLPESILIDEVRFKQILSNIIQNAIQFTNKGTVRVLVSCDFSSQDQSKLDLIIFIIDTGIGISRDHMETVFNPFESQTRQKNKAFGGSGLGLAISKNLLKMLNGEISVQSEEGKGSEFRIKFKDLEMVSDVNLCSRDKENLDPETIHFHPHTLLLVDDVETNLILLKIFLKEQNLIFIDAKNGREAIDLAKKHLPDIILTDLKMPILSGDEAAAIMKKDVQLRSIPIIVVTASVSEESKERYATLFDGFLTKPINKTKLINILARYLQFSVISADKEDIPMESSDDKVDQPDLQTVHELIHIIEKELEPVSEELINILSINKLNDLASLALSISEKYQYKPFKYWAARLYEQARKLDLEKIPSTLNQCSVILSDLKEISK